MKTPSAGFVLSSYRHPSLCFGESSLVYPTINGSTAADDSDKVVRVLAVIGLRDFCLTRSAGHRSATVGTRIVSVAVEHNGIAYLRSPSRLRGRRSSVHHGKVLCVDRATNSVPAVLRLVNDGSIAYDLTDNPILRFDPSGDSLAAVVDGIGSELHDVPNLDGTRFFGGRLRLDLGRCAEFGVDLCGNVSVSLVEICTGTRLVRIVSVNGHVTTVKVIHALVLVSTPNELLDTVTAANISHKLNEGIVSPVGNGIRLFGVRSYAEVFIPRLIYDRNSVLVSCANLKSDSSILRQSENTSSYAR